MMGKSKFLFLITAVPGVLLAMYSVYVFRFGYLCQDHAEHLHAAWLVWQGEVPYRDFFEHHNPLLWFVLAPLMPLFYHNALILYVARVIAFLAYVVMFIGFYRLSKDFLKLHAGSFWLALVLYFLNKTNLYVLFELQPDPFMYASFVWGLWYFFRFLDGQGQRALHISFILFTVSFLFLQKVLAMLGLLALYTIYLVWQKQIRWIALFKATVVPGIIILFFWLYLHFNNAENIYFLFNYELNWVMLKFVGWTKTNDEIMLAYLLPGLAMILAHGFLKTDNRYRNIMSWLLFADYLVKMSTWAPYVQYFIYINMMSALITADAAVQGIEKKKVKFLLLLLVLGESLYFCTMPMSLWFERYVRVHRYIMENSRKNEPIINTAYLFFNIYGKNPSYYWFGYQNIAPVAYYLYGYDEEPDINKMLYEKQPKFYYNVVFWNNFVAQVKDEEEYKEYLKTIYSQVPNKGEGAEAFAERWGKPVFYKTDEAFLNRYYTRTPIIPLVVRQDLR